MPKEMTHWMICQRAFSAMEPSPLKKSIARHRDAFLLGAVLYDTPMFSRFMGGGNPFEGVSERMHGSNGEDSLEPVRSFLSGLEGGMDAKTEALAAGILTHVAVDGAFHPLVYYSTGNYYHPAERERTRAVVRHRRFEVAVDLRFTEGGMPWNGGFFYNSLVDSGFKRERLEELLAMLWLGSSDDTPSVRTLLRWHSWVQYSIRRPWTSLAMHSLSPLLGGGWDETLASCYPPFRTKPPRWTGGAISYRNPVTGEGRRETLDEIADRAVEGCLRLLLVLENARGLPDRAVSGMAGMRGPSLETGTQGGRVSDMRFFRPSGAKDRYRNIG